MKNSLQKFLNLPFVQKNDTESKPMLLKLESEKNDLSQEIMVSDEKNMNDLVFEVKPRFTQFLFLNEKDFKYHEYDYLIDEESEDDEDYKIHRYIVTQYINREFVDTMFVKYLRFSENTNHISTINHKKNHYETIILCNDEDSKLFFIIRNNKTMICEKVISLNYFEMSSLKFIQERKDIWDDGFLGLFSSLKLFGVDNNFDNIEYLEKFYQNLGVTDTLTL